jgi:NADH-quinone oxidoreductase subunit M
MMAAALLLLPALFLPLLAALFLAWHQGSAASSKSSPGTASPAWLLCFSWIYAAVAAATAVMALRLDGGLSIAAPVMRLGVSGFELEPRLFLDGRGALFLLLLGLCPPVVFTILRGAMPGRSQMVCAWLLIFGLAGVFLADSLLLFYLFWEAALIAVYFWIGLHGRRGRAGAGGAAYPVLLRFVLFTLAGSLPMLASIAAVCAANFRDPGLRGLAATVSQLPDGTRPWVFLGFLLGFAVKLPLFGFHGWLRDTYNAAPPACRALLSAAMSKMGAFGLLLILAPAFPVEMARFAPALQILAVAGALYGGVLMLAQDRLTDLLAYASLSHLSLLALGIFSSFSATAAGAAGMETAGFSGAALLVFNHALIMALLFALDARILRDGASPDRVLLSGLRAGQKRLFAFLLLAVFASASLPGLNNFPGEVLVYWAAYKASPWLALFAGLGALIGAAALVRFLHNVFLGAPSSRPGDSGDAATAAARDLDRPETLLLLALSAFWLVIGLYPMLLLGPVERAFSLMNALGWTG